MTSFILNIFLSCVALQPPSALGRVCRGQSALPVGRAPFCFYPTYYCNSICRIVNKFLRVFWGKRKIFPPPLRIGGKKATIRDGREIYCACFFPPETGEQQARLIPAAQNRKLGFCDSMGTI